MRTVSKEIGTRTEKLGTIEFPVFDSLAEIVEVFGEASVLKLVDRAVRIDCERISRDLLKAGKSVEEAQAAVTNYKPGGTRSGKPTMKTLMALLTEFGEAGAIEHMLKAQGMAKGDNGIEVAHAYLTEQKAAGELNK